MGGGIKGEGKSDPLVQTKGAVGLTDKGNAIHRVTVNATHASAVWLHSAFSLIQLYRVPVPRPSVATKLKLAAFFYFEQLVLSVFLFDALLCGYEETSLAIF